MALSYPLDPKSCAIGMINCFVEMVACGVKPLAISPPVAPEDLELMTQASQDICAGFDVGYFVEQSLMVTDLQSEEFTKGKRSILYYKDPKAKEQYFALKEQAQQLEQRGEYHGEPRKAISIAFGMLLGYPKAVVEEKVERATDMPYVIGEEA